MNMDGGSSSNNGGGMVMMMGLCGENSNNTGSHNNNNNNNNGVFCPMMFVTSSSSANHTTNSSSPLQLPTTSTIIATADDYIRRLTAARGVVYMDADVCGSGSSVRAKIMAHPLYPRLIAAYASCQKVGAPPEVVAKLDEACSAAAAVAGTGGGCIGEDSGLDQFMEAYCEMLTKYEQELSKPFKEAMVFLQRIESHFKTLAVASTDPVFLDGNGSSEEEVDVNNGFIDPQAEDRELKNQLLQKYSGYLGSLKQEFMKKRKKGKLPKEARQQLLDWWSRHYKWPYPSESQKLALAELTGLHQKQINNWFINQRKRHWKPSEDVQFVVMDAAHHHPHYYMDNVLGTPFAMDITPTLL